MDFELCTPFGSEMFPHHGDSIPQALSTVVSASKETYQKQDFYCDEAKSTWFPHQVYYLDDTSPTQFPDFQLFDVQSVLIKSDDTQFICKGSTIWTSLKIIGVHKFVTLVVLDHGEKLICFPFDRGKLDCYLFLSGPPCLQAIVICVNTGQSMLSQIQSFRFDWRCIVYGIVRDGITAILPTFDKAVRIMYVVNATTFYFDLVTGFTIYKTYIFGDNDLVVTSSTLLLFGFVKSFILSSSLVTVKFFGIFQMMDYQEQSKFSTCIEQCDTFLQMFPLSSPHYCTVSNMEMMLLLCPQAQGQD